MLSKINTWIASNQGTVRTIAGVLAAAATATPPPASVYLLAAAAFVATLAGGPLPSASAPSK